MWGYSAQAILATFSPGKDMYMKDDCVLSVVGVSLSHSSLLQKARHPDSCREDPREASQEAVEIPFLRVWYFLHYASVSHLSRCSVILL